MRLQDEIRTEASFYCWMFFVVACGGLICSTTMYWSFGVMGQGLARRFRTALFGALLRQEVGWFDTANSGALASALSADTTYVRGAVGDAAGLLFQNLTCLFFGFLIAFVYDWRMALLVAGALGQLMRIDCLAVRSHLLYLPTVARWLVSSGPPP